MEPCGDRWMTLATLDRVGTFAEKCIVTGFGCVGVNLSQRVPIRLFQIEQLSNHFFGILFHYGRSAASAGFAVL